MEEQGLVVVKDSFLVRVTRTLKRFFFKGKLKKMIIDEEVLNMPIIKIDFISQDPDFVQEEIINARKAFRKYVINNKSISNDVFEYVIEKIIENENKIRKIIEINNEQISYEEILELLQSEKKQVSNFKLKDKITGCYQMPIGVIGVICENTRDVINIMFKCISTRNSIIILHENYSKYSTESLILLIVQECLKNFYIDDNIIQIVEKEEIDLTKLDKVIGIEDKEKYEKVNNYIYIYQEDESFEKEVADQIDKLNLIETYKDYEIKAIKGDFGNIVNYINENKPYIVYMYTNNSQKAYKIINWINSPNVFINTSIHKCKRIVSSNNNYYNLKYVLHKDVF